MKLPIISIDLNEFKHPEYCEHCGFYQSCGYDDMEEPENCNFAINKDLLNIINNIFKVVKK